MSEILRKFMNKTLGFLNQPSDNVGPGIFIVISIIIIVWSKSAGFSYAIIPGVLISLMMLIYTIMAIFKHQSIIKIFIYLIIEAMGISVTVACYLISKGVDFYLFEVIFPILLILLFIAIYINVKRTGNKEKIRTVIIGMILTMPLLILAAVSLAL